MASLTAGPYRPPVAVVAGGPPVAVPAVPIRPAAVAVARGPQGPAGAGGAFDYGFVRFDEVATGTIPLVENVPAPFRFIAPDAITDALRPPFAGGSYLDPDGMTIRARKSGDSYLIRVRLSVVTSRAGGTFTLGLFVTGSTIALQGANSVKDAFLTAPAGVSQRIDELFQVFPGSGFAANGAVFQMTSSVPAEVTPESLYITPEVAAP